MHRKEDILKQRIKTVTEMIEIVEELAEKDNHLTDVDFYVIETLMNLSYLKAEFEKGNDIKNISSVFLREYAESLFDEREE